MEKEKIIIVLFSFFLLLIATTYLIKENLIFSQHQNKYDPKSVNQENTGLHIMKIRYHEENFSSDFDIFGIKKIYPTKKKRF